MTDANARDELADQFVPGVDDMLLDLGLAWFFGGPNTEAEMTKRRDAYDARAEQEAREMEREARDAERQFTMLGPCP